MRVCPHGFGVVVPFQNVSGSHEDLSQGDHFPAKEIQSLERKRSTLAANHIPQIFVVDDERIIAEPLATILNRSGFRARSFVDPIDALSAARTATELDVPDMLISDVMMPRLSGIELAIQIKQLCPKCKVLLFSGQAGTTDLLQKARGEGHDFYLMSKPIHPSDLLFQVRRQATMNVDHASA